MNLFWIKVNPKLEEGIQLLNTIDDSNFRSLVQALSSLKDWEENIEQRIEAWQESLGLDVYKIQLLVKSVIYLLKHSSKVILKPTLLQKQLVEDLHMHQSKAEDFVRIWSSLIKDDFANLEYRQKLKDVSWEVNVQTWSSMGQKDVSPHVRMKLALPPENVQFELDETHLVEIYNTLESMQHKLDYIQSFNKH